MNLYIYLSKVQVDLSLFCQIRYNRTWLKCIQTSGSSNELSEGQVDLKVFVTPSGRGGLVIRSHQYFEAYTETNIFQYIHAGVKNDVKLDPVNPFH